MKKLSKITLAKTYDVLSESEMKHVVGGMGSGSGVQLQLFTCYHNWEKEDGTFVETEIGKVIADSSGVAKEAICATSTIANCKDVVYCKL